MKTKTMRGMGLVYERGGIWWIQISVRGQRIRGSSHSANRADAVRLLKSKIGDVKAGKPIGAQIERTTLDDLIRMLLDDYRANSRRSLARAEYAALHLKAVFGADTRASEITPDRVTAYQAQRQQESHQGKPVAVATINYELAMLRRAFRLAARAGKVATRPEFEMLHTSNARKGFFEPEQHRAVVERLPDHLKPLAQVAYITGWRRGELLSRQWRHVDLAAGWLRLDPGESKNEEGRMFPLTPELRSILEAQRERVRQIERETGRIVASVFVHADGSPIRDFRYSWAKACEAAGVAGRLVHDFRRTAVRNLDAPRAAFGRDENDGAQNRDSLSPLCDCR